MTIKKIKQGKNTQRLDNPALKYKTNLNCTFRDQHIHYSEFIHTAQKPDFLVTGNSFPIEFRQKNAEQKTTKQA